ncbi:hypothetical protein [Carboxydothermus islandicus]|uniref:hypothetical protein n=1 Tax=Carboxydothermus islandicus TaxID=661089 RepID=UPI0014125968|nr:hypothetical protein [Carboxydothermus islandicus]
MDDERKELILYRLQRAFEDLEVSRFKQQIIDAEKFIREIKEYIKRTYGITP